MSQLRVYKRLIPFKTNGIVYEAIAGHPDVFFCKTPEGIVYAPNTPHHYLQFFHQYGVKIIKGNLNLDQQYPATAYYNAVVTSQYLIHNLDITDKAILDSCHSLQPIHINQGYSRCSILSLSDKLFITSDRGVEKALKKNGLEALYVDPAPTVLQGFDHGFFGGCCGIDDDKFFITGSLSYFSNAQEIRSFIKKANLNIIELYDGPPLDGGSLLFV